MSKKLGCTLGTNLYMLEHRYVSTHFKDSILMIQIYIANNLELK